MIADVSDNKNFLIGLGISTATADDPVAAAVEAEELGYDFVSASDHPVGTQPTFENMALLTWIAARTTRIAVATRVLGVPFRRPALLAKTAESVQRLSGGRLILGLGGGHVDDEIAALGGPRLTPGQKVAGLDEAITVLRGGWSGRPFTLVGDQHRVDGLVLTPTPVATIPVWLGTYGPKALAVTGRQADGWIPSLGHAAPDRLPDMLARICDASVAVGRPADAVRPVYNLAVRLDPRAHSSGDEIAGRPRDIVDQLHELVVVGVRGFNLVAADGQARAVAEELLPPLRALT